jgi:glycerate kinase
MKILVAPDSFKGSLSAQDAAQAIARGIHRVMPSADCVLIPLADGGEGTVSALLHDPIHSSESTDSNDETGELRPTRIVTLKVTGPLGGRVRAQYALVDNGQTAIMEMAAASGMQYVDSTTMNPLLATSFGTGEMIRDALERGARTIILGLGGSATNDGGAGMAQALGVRLLDAYGHELSPGGAALASLNTIDLTNIDQRVAKLSLLLACDVNNPLTGPSGASIVFGPQKGADRAMTGTLDHALHHYAEVIRRQLHREVDDIPGAGAAGGLGAGCLAFTQASIHSGIDLIIDRRHVKDLAIGADYCFVAEGSIDAQTGRGKAPVGVAKAVKSVAPQCTVIAVAGAVGTEIDSLYAQGIDAIFSISPGAISLEYALRTAADNLSRCCENIMRLLV